MKMITAIIKPFKLDDVRESLSERGVLGMRRTHLFPVTTTSEAPESSETDPRACVCGSDAAVPTPESDIHRTWPGSERKPALRSERAFTLIELLIVVVIVGILATIAIPSYSRVRDRAMVWHEVHGVGAGHMHVGRIDDVHIGRQGLARCGWSDCSRIDTHLDEKLCPLLGCHQIIAFRYITQPVAMSAARDA